MERTLRSRLSSDAADTILYPPAPPATQLFYGSCADNGDAVNESKVYVQQSEGPEQPLDADVHYENGVDLESGDEDGPVVVRRSAGFRGSSLSPAPSSAPHLSNGDGSQAKSSAAGPDGYDAFENTNNKKKRKIPTPGNLGGHHSTLSPEFSTMGLANSAQSPSAAGDGSHGIISAAIANAAASAFTSPPPASGSVSMLDQQPTTPTKTQFTFTCESDSSKGMALQAQTAYSSHHRANRYGSQAREMSPGSPLSPQGHPSQNRAAATMTTNTATNSLGNVGNTTATGGTNAAAVNGADAPTGRKKKRSPGSIYTLAARQRKIQQQYANLHHPPSMEDIWICEFCEYESIFGHPPEALIRQYEIKDRKERKRLAEKKRLLEKAKMKGRKNKKATKNASKHAAAHPTAYDQGYDRASVDQASAVHDDEYLAHEYEEEEPDSAPPSAPPAAFKPPLPPGSQPTAAAHPGGAKGATDRGVNRPP
ncbi:hypothetical protein ATERTT37_004958 [Aspergillus terreus]